MSDPVGEGRKTLIIRNIELRIQQSNACGVGVEGGFRKLRGENRIKCWQAVGCLPLTPPPTHKTFAMRCKM